jgi:hypothetical protein
MCDGEKIAPLQEYSKNKFVKDLSDLYIAILVTMTKKHPFEVACSFFCSYLPDVSLLGHICSST